MGYVNVKQRMMFCRSGASRECQSSRLAPLLQSFIIRGGYQSMQVNLKQGWMFCSSSALAPMADRFRLGHENLVIQAARFTCPNSAVRTIS